MSSLSPSFPGYAKNVEFTRVDRCLRVYFLPEDSYLATLRDPSIILNAAYFTSPEHLLFLRNFAPASPLPHSEQTSRLKSLEFVLWGHGLLPVSDSYSWGVRRAHVISSRLQDRHLVKSRASFWDFFWSLSVLIDEFNFGCTVGSGSSPLSDHTNSGRYFDVSRLFLTRYY